MPTVWLWKIEWNQACDHLPKYIPAGDIDNALAKAKELSAGFLPAVIRGISCVAHFQVPTEEVQQELLRTRALL